MQISEKVSKQWKMFTTIIEYLPFAFFLMFKQIIDIARKFDMIYKSDLMIIFLPHSLDGLLGPSFKKVSLYDESFLFLTYTLKSKV